MRRPALVLLLVLLLAACGGDEETGGTDTTGPGPTTPTNGPTETGNGGGTTTGGGDGIRPCTVDTGRVLGYLPLVQRETCDPRNLLRGATLFGADQVTTGAVGRLEFSAGRLERCTTWPGTVIVVRPEADTLLRLVSGTVVCEASAGGEDRIDVPGAEVRVTGTLFTLESSGTETTVRVHEGSVEVVPTGGSAATVSGGGQAVAASGGVAREPYAIGGVEAERLAALRLGVLTLPQDALRDLGGASASATLVTETDEQGEFVLQRGMVRSSQAITTQTVFQRSSLQLAGDVVVGIGEFAALQDAFEQLRKRLGPGGTIVFSPFDFPETGSTETTTTDTTATGTTATGTTTTETTTTETTRTATVPATPTVAAVQ